MAAQLLATPDDCDPEFEEIHARLQKFRLADSSQPVVLVAVDVVDSPWRLLIQRAAFNARDRLYVALNGPAVAQPSQECLEVLRKVFDCAVVESKPLLDIVPLCGALGWTWGDWTLPEKVDAVLGFQEIPEVFAESAELKGGPFCTPEQLDGAAETPLATHAHLAVGGTFDRLHAGHRLLLAATVAAAAEGATVYVGVAGDELLKKKTHADLLEPFDARADAVVAFLKRCRPGLNVEVSALLDPAAPPKAATMPEITGLVVSLETVAGAEKLMAQRRERLGADAPPLEVVSAGLVGADEQRADAPKLASSRLRATAAGADPPEATLPKEPHPGWNWRGPTPAARWEKRGGDGGDHGADPAIDPDKRDEAEAYCRKIIDDHVFGVTELKEWVLPIGGVCPEAAAEADRMIAAAEASGEVVASD